PLPTSPRRPLRATAAREQSQLDFGLAELGVLDGDPDGACHGRFATTAERKTIDGCNHRFAEVLDEIEDSLPEAARPFRFERPDMRELADVCSGDERLVPSPREDDTAH